MRAAITLGCAATLVFGACTTSSTGIDLPLAGDVTIFAASSLVDAFRAIGDDLKKSNPSARFTFNFGSSSTLATQITNGAPADVFASADEASVQKVVARYPIAVVKDAKNAQLAWRFVQYLVSPAGQTSLAEFGFSKP